MPKTKTKNVFYLLENAIPQNDFEGKDLTLEIVLRMGVGATH